MKKCNYKKGGKVKKSKEVKAEGSKTKVRLDKFARGGAAKKGKTTVNVIVAPQNGAPPVAPPMAPPGPGPMMKPPGLKTGGVAKMTGGAGGGIGRLEKAADAKKTK